MTDRSYHGAWCWRENFMPYFSAAGYDCYAVSLRGQGGSERGNLKARGPWWLRLFPLLLRTTHCTVRHTRSGAGYEASASRAYVCWRACALACTSDGSI